MMHHHVETTYFTLSADKCLVAKVAVSWVKDTDNKAQSYTGSKHDGGS
jgi:hypothetical protein